jgi:amyloid beta precursor protein binding protein 1
MVPKRYRQKAKQDIECIKIRVQALLKTLDKPDDFITLEEIERVCKHANFLVVQRYRSIASELSHPQTALLSNKLRDLDDPIVFYILLRAVDRFHEQYHRFPGMHLEEVDADVGLFKRCVTSLLSDLGINGPTATVSDDAIHEM